MDADIVVLIVFSFFAAVVATIRPVRRKNRQRRYDMGGKVILPHIDVEYEVERETS